MSRSERLKPKRDHKVDNAACFVACNSSQMFLYLCCCCCCLQIKYTVNDQPSWHPLSVIPIDSPVLKAWRKRHPRFIGDEQEVKEAEQRKGKEKEDEPAAAAAQSAPKKQKVESKPKAKAKVEKSEESESEEDEERGKQPKQTISEFIAHYSPLINKLRKDLLNKDPIESDAAGLRYLQASGATHSKEQFRNEQEIIERVKSEDRSWLHYLISDYPSTKKEEMTAALANWQKPQAAASSK